MKQWLVRAVILVLLLPFNRVGKMALASLQYYKAILKRANKKVITPDMKDANQLYMTEEWCQMVGKAIGQTPEYVRSEVNRLWNLGWSIRAIHNELRSLAMANGKQLFFSEAGEPS